jgi:hypothetical protein
MFKLLSDAEGFLPRGKRAVDFDGIAALLRATSFGLILPGIFYVNDLSHPFQTGLLFFLFPLGILASNLIFGGHGGTSILRAAFSVVTYLSIAAAAYLQTEGIAELRAAQTIVFLLGFFAGSPITRRSGSLTNSITGVSIGALLSAALTRNCIRGSQRYDLAVMMVPALAAAVSSATALVFMARRRRISDNSAHSQPRQSIRETLAHRDPELLCIMGLSACTALSAAIVCTLAPMMIWESFGFSASASALMFAKAGFVVICVNFVVSRALARRVSASGASSFAWVGLAMLGFGACGLMWSPWTQAGMELFTGVAAYTIGWGCWQAARSRLAPGWFAGAGQATGPVLNDLAVLLAWIVGPILSASIFYAHERTSFGLAGVVILPAAVLLFVTQRRGKKA